MALRWATDVEYDALDYLSLPYPGMRKIYMGAGIWDVAIPDDLPTCDYCGLWDEAAIDFGRGWCGECGQCDWDCECD